MFINSFFAFTKVETDPELNKLFLFLMAIPIVAAIGLVLYHVTPYLIKRYKEKRVTEIETSRKLSFDPTKSTLNRGTHELAIPDNSLEYFVCKLVFDEREKPQLDLNVLEAAGRKDDDGDDPRAVEQAVRRVNKKAKDTLQLKGDLLLRRKEKTFLNEIDNLV